MSDIVTEFNDYRSKMNDTILEDNNKIIKRIFNLDTNAFAEGGTLDKKKKMHNQTQNSTTGFFK